MFKINNEKCTCNVYTHCNLLYALKVRNCLNFKIVSKEKTNFFCLIKLLFIKVRCLINVNVRLILKDKGGKQHSLSFVGSNLGGEIFLKKRELQKRMR